MRGLGFFVITVGLLLSPNAVPSQKKDPPRKVRDDANLFSKEALERTQAIINEVGERHRLDLFIDTLEQGPEEAKEFPAWAKKRADDLNIEGVYIVITNKPKRFEVVVGLKTRERGLLTLADRNEVVKLLPGLAKDRDATLEKAVKSVLDAANKNAKTHAEERARLIGFWLGPEVALKKGNAKGRLRLQILEMDGQPFAKLGYQAKDVKELTGTYAIQFKHDPRQAVLKEFDGDKDLVLGFELKDDTLKIDAARMVQLTGAQGQVSLTGAWQRVTKK